MNYAPVALFVYNRPWHTRQAVEALQASPLAAQTHLHIFSDAPKNEDATKSVQQVRDYVRTVSGFKEVTIVERENNWGLARSIIHGVSQLCDQYGRVIVLEDDLVVSPVFLTFMNNALDRYVDDDQVMQVAGYMFPVEVDVPCDAMFMTFISSWGWATWQRAWRHFDPDAKGYKHLIEDRASRNRFDLDGGYQYFKMLRAQQEGRSESWAIRWYLSVFLRNGLTLYPVKTMVRNLGFDGSGVNCAVSAIQEAEMEPGFQVVRFPEILEASPMQQVVVHNLPAPHLNLASITQKLLGFIKRMIRF